MLAVLKLHQHNIPSTKAIIVRVHLMNITEQCNPKQTHNMAWGQIRQHNKKMRRLQVQLIYIHIKFIVHRAT